MSRIKSEMISLTAFKLSTFFIQSEVVKFLC